MSTEQITDERIEAVLEGLCRMRLATEHFSLNGERLRNAMDTITQLRADLAAANERAEIAETTLDAVGRGSKILQKELALAEKQRDEAVHVLDEIEDRALYACGMRNVREEVMLFEDMNTIADEAGDARSRIRELGEKETTDE